MTKLIFYVFVVFISIISIRCADQENEPPQFWRGCAMELCYYNKDNKELELCKYDCQIRSHWLKKINNKWQEI